MELTGYFRSSAAYRVRTALNLKQLDYDHISLSLLKGDHKSSEYLDLNPQGFVPFFKDKEVSMAQSIAVLEYLEETYPEIPLLPKDATGRSRVRWLSGIIACDIHPLDNLRVLKYLTGALEVTEEQKTAWYHHWILEGFKAFEAILTQQDTGTYCHGDNVTLADVCLVPQVYNAVRFDCPLDDFPNILRITDNLNNLDAFISALPENQFDAP